MTDAALEVPVELNARFEATGRVRAYVPPGRPPSAYATIVVVHGYGRSLEELPALARRVAPDALVLAPAGPSAFYRGGASAGGRARGIGHGWIAASPREPDDRRNSAYLASALESAADRWPLDPYRTFLMAFSQGVGVATHFWLTHPNAAAGLIGLAGGVAQPYRAGLDRFAGRPVLWVTGRRDRAYPHAYTEAVLAAWRAARAEIDSVVVDTGHVVLGAAEAAVRTWLAPRLR